MANSIKLFDKSSGELLSEYSGHINKEYRLDCCLDHTDKYVLSGSENGQVSFGKLLTCTYMYIIIMNGVMSMQ